MAEACRYRVNSNSSLRPAYVGGNYNDNANYGFFYFNANNDASNTNSNLGSRNLFKDGISTNWNPDGCEYKIGDRVRVDGTLYKVLQAHTSQPTWNPGAAAALFAEVLPGQGGTEIGEWVQPDSTNPYMEGDRVIFNGSTYESLIDNNVWSPADYPAGWEKVD